MAYEHINITKFDGLNTTAASELIDDTIGTARDIYNFHAEKIGKLYTRDGYLFGLYIDGVMPKPYVASEFDVTFTDAGDLVTRAGHGLINGQIVQFTSISTTTGLDINADYYVINSTLDTFQVSETLGGNAVELNNDGMGKMTDGVTMELLPQTMAFVQNAGIIGIGEHKLSGSDKVMDSDKFMVYVVRGVKENGKYTECYLFSPMNGKYKNMLATDISAINPGSEFVLDANNKCYDTPKAVAPNMHLLYAPERNIPTDVTAYDESNWINHYVDIKPAGNKLVVSDRINGDMIVEDEYDLARNNQCGDVRHKMKIRPACKETFDIDNVHILDRIGAGEENEKIENGMALYGYKLPKSHMEGTVAHNDNMISNVDWLGGDLLMPDAEQDQPPPALLGRVADYMSATNTPNTFWTATCNTGPMAFTPDATMTQYISRINATNKFVFTNAEIAGQEYDDVLGQLELAEEKYIDENGRTIKESPADVYIWNDLKLNYYPCSGSSLLYKYLTDIDRIFSKLNPNTPRITTFNALDQYARRVPLGVWQYKFVWEFSDGTYSSDSAPLNVYDRLFSATQDEELTYGTRYKRKIDPHGMERLVNAYIGGYRAIKPANYEFSKCVLDANYLRAGASNFITPTFSFGKLFKDTYYSPTNGIGITPLGENVYRIKEKLYGGTNNKYGIIGLPSLDTIKGWDLPSASDNDYANYFNLLGNFGCMITANFGSGNLETKNGWIFEGLNIPIYDFKYFWEKGEDDDIIFRDKNGAEYTLKFNRDYVATYMPGMDIYSHDCRTYAVPLTIPIFASESDARTFNSLADNEGRLRLSWIENPIRILGDNIRPQFQLTSPLWYSPHSRLGGKPYRGSHSFGTNVRRGCFMIAEPPYSSVMLNIVPHYLELTAGDVDKNNAFTPAYLNLIRPATLLRVVKSETERLSWTDDGVDQEAIERLILTGIAGINILDYGDAVNSINITARLTALEDTSYTIPLSTCYIYDKLSIIEQYAHDETRLICMDGNTVDVAGHGKHVSRNNYALSNTTPVFANQNDGLADNLRVTIYGAADRFIGIEQLTSFFPTSLLTGAPRVGIKINKNKIPQLAAKLKIFRTHSTHSNDYDPTQFGLVKDIDIVAGEDLYFFDDIPDKSIDFGDTPSDYTGKTVQNYSRFNETLYGRTHIFNFIEKYQPIAPRGFIDNSAWYKVLAKDATDTSGNYFTSPITLEYKIIYEDESRGIASQAKYISVSTGIGNAIVALYLLPTPYSGVVNKVKIYRKGIADSRGNLEYFRIGDISDKDSGIFIDNNLPNLEIMPCTNADITNYSGGHRWSENNEPDWYKAENFTMYDGNITGALAVDADLIIFTETSIARLTLIGDEIPIRSTDIITKNVGCIAPNALVGVGDAVYFLSASGLYKYNNNIVVRVDEKFSNQLQNLIAAVGVESFRDTSMAYNPAHNEIYFNFPPPPTWKLDNLQTETGTIEKYNYGEGTAQDRDIKYLNDEILGNIFVLNIATGIVTKYGYQPTLYYGAPNASVALRKIEDPRQLVRKYFTNSIGELRSGDIFPVEHYHKDNSVTTKVAGIFIETPYPREEVVKTDTDTITTTVTFRDYDDVLYNDIADLTNIANYGAQFKYPKYVKMPIKVIFRSKFITLGSETIHKRVRKILANIFSKGKITIRGISYPVTEFYSLINRNKLSINNETFIFNPSVDSYDYLNALVTTGTNSNQYSVIPANVVAADETQNDLYGKGIKYAIEIEGSMRTELNSIEILIRAINTYLR